MYRWKAEIQWEGLYKERNPFRKGDEHSTEKERERKLTLTVKRSTLIVNEQSLPEPAQGRIYTKFVCLLFMIIALVLLSSSL